MDIHHSWNNSINENILSKIKEYQYRCIENNKYIRYNNNEQGISYYNKLIPIYDLKKIKINPVTEEYIYNNFFNDVGVLIVKNAYSIDTMDKFNIWCEEALETYKEDPNIIHPKQKDKFTINNIIERMSESNPDLLMKLINNKYLNKFCDILLGFHKFGSCTAHWINPGGDRQLAHVDYPIHIGSGPFWESSVDKMKKFVNRYQLNNILPYYSIQALIASDNMSIENGSTEVIPCSHLIDNIDILVQDFNIREKLENLFFNVSLDKGDFLIFNRRLCHRGGKNISNFRRNSLIIQSVWFWSIGQEIINFEKIINLLERKSKKYNLLTNEEREIFNLRLKHPYPTDVTKIT